MKNIDYLSLDGRSLRTFMVVLDEVSVSRAAQRLGVTQSAVSHCLDKLRLALGDPLFVRAGRGIVATDRALALREPVQAVLDDLKALTDERVFDPTMVSLQYTIAANDFQRDLIFPDLLRELANEGVDIQVRFMPSGIPSLDLLRQAQCQWVVTPVPPEGPDIFQIRLFTDEVVCFYDSEVRAAPASQQEFASAEQIEVRFDHQHRSDDWSGSVGSLPIAQPRISVPNFAALPAFLRGSNYIVPQLKLMGRVNLRGFASAPLPFKTEPVSMYLVWHRRDQHDPAHRWLRERIVQATAGLRAAQAS